MWTIADLVSRYREKREGKARHRARKPLVDFAYDGPRPATKRESTQMEDLFWTHQGPVIHKWHHYLPIYDRYFRTWQGQPVRMLEIGVSLGGSLELWRKYFGPQAVIFGIDIDPNCAAFDGRAGQVRIGSQADPEFLRKIVQEMGGVDIVLDDGSHLSAHMRASLDVLYPLLSEGGVYMVEDLHACYWKSYDGGYRHPGSFVEVVKTMIDDMHHWHHNQGQRVGATAGAIQAMHVYDSLVVLEKGAVDQPRRSHRGQE